MPMILFRIPVVTEDTGKSERRKREIANDTDYAEIDFSYDFDNFENNFEADMNSADIDSNFEPSIDLPNGDSFELQFIYYRTPPLLNTAQILLDPLIIEVD